MGNENKMQTILTVNGKQYSVQSPPGWVLEPADIERAKQDILSGNIKTMNPATCPDVIQGTTHAVTLTATGGVPDYTYRLLLDGSQIATAGPIAGTSQTFDYKFDQAVGAHILKGEITDSCSTPQTSSDQCATFNIIAAVGSISCTTTPSGASVALDDVSQGVVTPVTLTDVTPGSHTVTFTLTGYNACPVTVSVTAGATATASCTLVPVVTTGSISCTTTPSGASVTLDGTLQTGVITPVTLTNVSAGSHTVTFGLSGYNACPVTVSVTAGATATASCTLCIIPSCEFTWAPLNPVINQDITFTASETVSIAGWDWYVRVTGTTTWVHWDFSSVTVIDFSVPDEYDIRLDIINSCGATCTMTKQIIVLDACSPLEITMNVV